MTDGVSKDNIVEEVKDMTEEERAAAWEKWVRSELNSALDIFLPISKAGDVFTSYRAHKLEQLETGPVYSKNLASGVSITMVFEFEKPIDVTKPQDEQE